MSSRSIEVIRSFDEWQEFRRRGIGGSDAPIIMRTSKWSTRFELWSRKLRWLGPQPVTYPMRRGLSLEPRARKRYEQVVGFSAPRKVVRHSEEKFLIGNLDGFNADARRAVEFKCPGKEDHALALKGEVPRHYVFQLVHYLMVLGFPSMDYFSFYPLAKHSRDRDVRKHEEALVRFKRDTRLENDYLREARSFWKLMTTFVPPEFEDIEFQEPAAAASSSPLSKLILPTNVVPLRNKRKWDFSVRR